MRERKQWEKKKGKKEKGEREKNAQKTTIAIIEDLHTLLSIDVKFGL